MKKILSMALNMAAAMSMFTFSTTASAQLGALTTDLVFTPVSPCRIIDTRNAGGVIAGGSTRDFEVTSTANYTAQGGSATNCGGAGANGNYAAVLLNFTAVTPTAAGFMTAYPAGTTRPLATVMSYNAGDIRDNSAVIKLNQTGGADLTIFVTGSTHVTADVLGYYSQPVATALECVNLNIVQAVAANTIFNFATPACTAGYTMTGAGCRTPGFNQAAWAINGIFNSPSGYCSGTNITASSVNVDGTTRCCRIPGR